jgi:hypothetical protein
MIGTLENGLDGSDVRTLLGGSKSGAAGRSANGYARGGPVTPGIESKLLGKTRIRMSRDVPTSRCRPASLRQVIENEEFFGWFPMGGRCVNLRAGMVTQAKHGSRMGLEGHGKDLEWIG